MDMSNSCMIEETEQLERKKRCCWNYLVGKTEVKRMSISRELLLCQTCVMLKPVRLFFGICRSLKIRQLRYVRAKVTQAKYKRLFLIWYRFFGQEQSSIFQFLGNYKVRWVGTLDRLLTIVLAKDMKLIRNCNSFLKTSCLNLGKYGDISGYCVTTTN